MDIAFKVGVLIMLLVLSFGYIETRMQHKAAVETHSQITEKLQNYVMDRLDHMQLPHKGKK